MPVSKDVCAVLTIFPISIQDIYLFGGKSVNEDGTVTSSNEIHKLSIGECVAADLFVDQIFLTHVSLLPAKMKWKLPLYVGIPPTRRHGHTAFILHSHVSILPNTC